MTSSTGSVHGGFGGFEKSQLVESTPRKKKVAFQTCAGPDDFVCYGLACWLG